MLVNRAVWVVDSHTAGEPTRIVVGGVPPVPGNSMAEKKAYLSSHLDGLRKMLMWEPRGHRDMFGSILLPPVNPEADLGIVFMDGGGYLDMCGHGTIGAATVVVELGIIKPLEPVTLVRFDTPAGLVEARVLVKEGRVQGVTVRNVPAFLHTGGLRIEVEGLGEIEVDVAFGGNFFAIVDADVLGLEIVPQRASKLVELGLKIRDAVNRAIRVSHPEKPHIDRVNLVEFSSARSGPGSHRRNAVIFADGQLDRSPCGTGTCAKMASLFARGKLKLMEDFVHESILGTRFTGRVVDTTKVGSFEAVIPEITGRAHITAISQFLLDPEDPLAEGFVLG